jgi:hypothetical protein
VNRSWAAAQKRGAYPPGWRATTINHSLVDGVNVTEEVREFYYSDGTIEDIE